MLSSEFQQRVAKHLLQNNFEDAIKNKDTTEVKQCLLDPELDLFCAITESFVCTNITINLTQLIL